MNTMATFQEFEGLLLTDPGIPKAAMSNVQQAIRRTWDALRVKRGMAPVFNKALPQSLLDTLPDCPEESDPESETPAAVFSEDNW